MGIRLYKVISVSGCIRRTPVLFFWIPRVSKRSRVSTNYFRERPRLPPPNSASNSKRRDKTAGKVGDVLHAEKNVSYLRNDSHIAEELQSGEPSFFVCLIDYCYSVSDDNLAGALPTITFSVRITRRYSRCRKETVIF